MIQSVYVNQMCEPFKKDLLQNYQSYFNLTPENLSFIKKYVFVDIELPQFLIDISNSL